MAPSVRFGFELAVWNLYASSSGSTLPETDDASRIIDVQRLERI